MLPSYPEYFLKLQLTPSTQISELMIYLKLIIYFRAAAVVRSAAVGGTCSYRPPEPKDTGSLSWRCRLGRSGGGRFSSCLFTRSLDSLGAQARKGMPRTRQRRVPVSALIIITCRPYDSRTRAFTFIASSLRLVCVIFLAYLSFFPEYYQFCTR